MAVKRLTLPTSRMVNQDAVIVNRVPARGSRWRGEQPGGTTTTSPPISTTTTTTASTTTTITGTTVTTTSVGATEYQWDPNKTQNHDLTGNNRIATANASSTGQSTSSVWEKAGGKWYWEVEVIDVGATNCCWGFAQWGGNYDETQRPGFTDDSWGIYDYIGNAVRFYNNSSFTQVDIGAGIQDGDILMFAIDKDTGKMWFGRNGTWLDTTGSPQAGTDPNFTSTTMANAAIFVGTGYGRSIGDEFKCRFRADQMTYAIPTNGFKSPDGFTSIQTSTTSTTTTT